MAFSTAGSPVWGSGPAIDLDIAYDYQRSGADMQYKIRITANPLRSSSSYFGYPIYASITLDGSKKVSGHTVKAASPSTWSSAIVYTTDWLTVSGKTTGNTTLGVNVYSGSGCNRDSTYSYSLPVSPGASNVSASSGTLGAAQTLTVTRFNSSFTHTITYACGKASGTVVNKSSSTSISWVPPLSLAQQNTTGSSVSIKLTITTYSGGTQVGDAKSTTITASIPASVKPTASITLTDPTGLKESYSGYVQGKSQLKVAVTGTGSQGSTIKAYKIRIGDKSYSGGSVTVDLPSSGSLKVTGYVTDSRSRSGASAEATITITAYTPPKITKLAAARCTVGGVDQPDGAYVKATFSAVITSLNNRNTAAYKIQYRKEGTSSWTTVTVPGLSGNYAPVDASVVFMAAPGAAYDVQASSADAFQTVYSSTRTVPVAFALLQCDATGTGLAIGQQAIKANTFAVGIDAEFYGGLTHGGYNYFETDWIDLGLSASVRAASADTGNYPGCAYRVIGRHVFVACNCGFDFNGASITVSNTAIPARYRPPRGQYALCPVGGRSIARLIVNPSGKLVVDWVQSLTSGTTTEALTVYWFSGYLDYWI